MSAPTRRAPVQVREIADADVDGAASAITAGFIDNEIWSWMIPAERRRRRTLERYHRSVIKRLFIPRGGCWTTADRLGAALWAPPGTWRLSLAEQAAEMLPLILWAGPRALARGLQLDALFSRYRPSEPHWYLSVLAVDPRVQRRGYGSALMVPGLERADADGAGAWLETQRHENVPFYHRFGFVLVREVAIEGGPEAWLMWREPR